MLAAVLLIAVPLAHAGNGNNCAFQAKGLVLTFGSLDPSAGSNVSNLPVQELSLNAKKWGQCAPGTNMTLSADNGLHFSGSRRMKRASPAATNDYIAYSLAGLPTGVPGPGPNDYVAFTFTGTLMGSDYVNAPAGTYEDTVQITVTP